MAVADSRPPDHQDAGSVELAAPLLGNPEPPARPSGDQVRDRADRGEDGHREPEHVPLLSVQMTIPLRPHDAVDPDHSLRRGLPAGEHRRRLIPPGDLAI